MPNQPSNLQNMRRFHLVYQKYETLSSISENQKQPTPSRDANSMR